jgi:hypothetical protein
LLDEYAEIKIETVTPGAELRARSNEATLGQRVLDTWVCDETYLPLFTALKDPPDEPVLYVSGTIYKNRTTEFNNWYLTAGLPDPVDQGEYTVECLSDAGEVLYSTGFGYEAEEYLGFGFVIPYPEGTTKVRFSKDGVLLGRGLRQHTLPQSLWKHLTA